jgi:FMN-dependent oxidoreductase (nitrilotriacetate monooxygenase family)
VTLERRHLNLVVFGQPEGWWDYRAQAPTSPGEVFPFIADFARHAERARIDAYFRADFLGFDPGNVSGDPSGLFEPLSVVAALAPVTERIGLVTTASTTFFEPFNVARQVASLHGISGGRAGWNAVTSFNGEGNFGGVPFGDPAERYARATEFIEVVLKLWRSWEPDALSFATDRPARLDPSRVTEIAHRGAHYSVAHALDVSRLVEDTPVVFQAGASDDGVRFASRYGEAVFVATPDIEHAHDYTGRLKSLAAGHGRHPDSIRVLPGVRTYIGDTEDAAYAEYREVYQDEAYFTSRRAWLRREAPFFDLEGLELDDVIPADRIPSREQLEASTRRISRGLLLRDLVLELEGRTLRDFLERIHGHGHLDVVGTPEQVAEVFAEWFASRASDGFTLHGGNSFTRLTDEVFPLLRAQGLLREEYEGTTLREHLGLG